MAVGEIGGTGSPPRNQGDPCLAGTAPGHVAEVVGVGEGTVRGIEDGKAVDPSPSGAVAGTRVSATASDLPDDPRQEAFVASVALPGARHGDVVAWPVVQAPPDPAPVPRWMAVAAKAGAWRPALVFWVGVSVCVALQRVLPSWAADATLVLFLATNVGLASLTRICGGPGWRGAGVDWMAERDRSTAYVLGRASVTTLHVPGSGGVRRVEVPVASLDSVDWREEDGLVTARLSGALGDVTLERMPAGDAVARRLVEWSAAVAERAGAGREPSDS